MRSYKIVTKDAPHAVHSIGYQHEQWAQDVIDADGFADGWINDETAVNGFIVVEEVAP